jgi:hypothetical protein
VALLAPLVVEDFPDMAIVNSEIGIGTFNFSKGIDGI